MGTLTVKAIDGLGPGRHHDGGGLYLNITPKMTRSWFVRYQRHGKRHDLGLGSYPAVGLADARDKNRGLREQLANGLDPKAERTRAKQVPTFREAAKIVYDANKGEWRNPKHVAQWWSTLETYVFPRIGDLQVSAIGSDHVIEVLEPIWLTKPETARRVRQRVFMVLDWATGKKFREFPVHREGVNNSLPRIKRVVRHRPAMEFAEIRNFLPVLRERETMGRMALEAAILTATRSGEVRLARWPEVNFEEALWSIPGERMKAGKPHVIPLSRQALAIFERARELRYEGQEFIFAGAKRGRPLSDMTLLKAMRDMGLESVPHGFRSSFRDWGAEETEFQSEAIRVCMAHSISDKVDRAYRRGKHLKKRRAIMQAWADYCEGVAGA